jgi:hypothetical protein
MALPIFPYLPLPATIDRTWNWGESVILYDSGEQQADTPFVKPLLRWGIPVKLMNEIRQNSLVGFVNAVKGMTRPFLLKDPYEFRVNSALAVRSGITNGGSLYINDTRGYMVRPDSTTVSTLFSTLSGYVSLGAEFSLDQDTGVVTVNTKAAADVWGVRSMEYWRKVKFAAPYQENAIIWNLFSADMTVVELP